MIKSENNSSEQCRFLESQNLSNCRFWAAPNINYFELKFGTLVEHNSIDI
jgi:hypothetical protein